MAAEYGSARDAARMRGELRTARDLQLSMLPDAARVLDWANIAGVSIPATEVGGDYYDYFLVEGGVAVVCADVAGHGLASGITLATRSSSGSAPSSRKAAAGACWSRCRFCCWIARRGRRPSPPPAIRR